MTRYTPPASVEKVSQYRDYKAYKKRMEEAKKRDHRVLGKKLDLFSIQVGHLLLISLP